MVVNMEPATEGNPCEIAPRRVKRWRSSRRERREDSLELALLLEHDDLDRIALSCDGNGDRCDARAIKYDQIERGGRCNQRAVELFRLRLQLGGGVAGVAQELQRLRLAGGDHADDRHADMNADANAQRCLELAGELGVEHLEAAPH